LASLRNLSYIPLEPQGIVLKPQEEILFLFLQQHHQQQQKQQPTKDKVKEKQTLDRYCLIYVDLSEFKLTYL